MSPRLGEADSRGGGSRRLTESDQLCAKAWRTGENTPRKSGRAGHRPDVRRRFRRQNESSVNSPNPYNTSHRSRSGPEYTMQSEELNACGDPSYERNLLSAAAVRQWTGTPVSWIEVTPHLARADLVTERHGLVMIDSGATHADFRFGNRSVSCDFRPGAIGLFTAGTELKFSRWRWSGTRRIYLDLETALPGMEELQEPLKGAPLQTELEFRDPELTSVLRIMAAEAANGSPNGRLFAESLSLAVAMRLRKRAASRLAARRERGKLSRAQLAAVDEVLRFQLHNRISLATLAQATGFSTPQFVRLFKNSTGRTPHQHVMAARLERARELVVAGEMSLSMIAQVTGFANQGHMTGAFVRAFMTPPGEMRRAVRKTG